MHNERFVRTNPKVDGKLTGHLQGDRARSLLENGNLLFKTMQLPAGVAMPRYNKACNVGVARVVGEKKNNLQRSKDLGKE